VGRARCHLRGAGGGRTVLAAVAACAALAALPALAPAQSTPKPLWDEFPLEPRQRPTSPTSSPAVGSAPARAGDEERRAPRAAAPATGGEVRGAWLLLLALAAGGLALLAGIGRAARRKVPALAPRPRREPAVEPERFFVAAPRARPASAPLRAPVHQRAPEPRPPAPPVAAASPPRRRTKGPTCQVRWTPRASRFTAIRVDDDGVEHRVAVSPRIAPPDGPLPGQSHEAQRALRALAKDLRAEGWRPLRAKGRDFGEVQWYTRRFTLDPPEPAGDTEAA
jgi:hypothetical protein